MLHSDAKRLFAGEGEGEDVWQTEYELKKYKSLKQAGRHAVRDGTAFASIALPAHYAAIYSVLSHLKRRLEPGWQVAKVIDWGAGTGSGLWCKLIDFVSLSGFTYTFVAGRPCTHSKIHQTQRRESQKKIPSWRTRMY